MPGAVLNAYGQSDVLAKDVPDVTFTIAGAEGPGELQSVPDAHDASAD